MPGPPADLPVEIDQGPESPRLTPDDGHHQGKSQRARTRERLWSPAHPQPYRQGILHGPRVDALPRQGGPISARPVDVFVLTDIQEQVELLDEEGVVVLEAQTEEWKGLDER